MTVPVPLVGAIVQYFPGAPDRRHGFAPQAAIVTLVGGSAPDWGVYLTIFEVDGTTYAKSRVLHKDSWTSGGSPDAIGYWAWVGGEAMIEGGT